MSARAANDERELTPFEQEIEAASRFNPASVLMHTPLELAFLNSPSPEKRVCITCGAPHFGFAPECSGRLSLPEH